jgi:hypothetical protein
MKVQNILPLVSVMDPDTEDFQTWANTNAHDLHGATVEAAHVMACTPGIDSVLVATFAWEDEVYADMSLQREDIQDSLNLAIDYYVENELYEFAAYAKSIIDEITKNK